ncbi:hypothetical protein [Deinococcus soli (ex Cha et al. 2016)]|uniref:Uncharacterized protein n=2 Tax=Deinococcus soli (ex Cha et al. 2016) TaxID=1309411 RepID=A0AAE3XBE8_9DEIO|nr:hypothetical protein [Deinococcus soli (ex Cha et al. 2016)]MDR6218171.1 hypothetical protein [Deinococcus soli (ex Cha et al. 2016)]MDR6328911.1 hypothetical protein [Deinococcus soli (ex Cha et al. 2016)]MDR6751601.1 hypothetical protein [Deinococcus soli (ex Cha et al. 2016)]
MRLNRLKYPFLTLIAMLCVAAVKIPVRLLNSGLDAAAFRLWRRFQRARRAQHLSAAAAPPNIAFDGPRSEPLWRRHAVPEDAVVLKFQPA